MVSYCHFCNLNSCDGLLNTQIGEGEEREERGNVYVSVSLSVRVCHGYDRVSAQPLRTSVALSLSLLSRAMALRTNTVQTNEGQ